MAFNANLAMDNTDLDVEEERMLMKETPSLLVGRLKAMTWAARAKDAALREMRLQLADARRELAAGRLREQNAMAEVERLRAEVAASRRAEERLAADMAEVEAEAATHAVEWVRRITRLEAELAAHQASRPASPEHHSSKQRDEGEQPMWQAEAVMWRETAETMTRRAEVAEAAEERLANQIAELEAESHRAAMESRRMMESLQNRGEASEGTGTATPGSGSGSEEEEEEAPQPFIPTPAYLQAICERLLDTSSATSALAKGASPTPATTMAGETMAPAKAKAKIGDLGMRLKLWNSSSLVLQAVHT